MAPAIGIDLGTSYSCVGVFQNGQIEIIANSQGHRTTPSMVTFTNTGTLVGEAASYKTCDTNPANTLSNIKRLMGRSFEDQTVQQDMKTLPYRVVSDDGKLKVSVNHNSHCLLYTSPSPRD